MMNKPSALFCLLATLLCACGGGGSSQSAGPVQAAPSPAPPVPVGQVPPTDVPAGPVTLSGTVSALDSNGLQLSLDAEILSVPANATSLMFSSKVAKGALYVVRIASQPLGPTNCSVQNAVGEAGTANITNINVACRATQASATVFAQAYSPQGITFDPSGAMSVTSGNAIRKVTASGAVTMIGEIPGFGAYVDGAAGIARFSSPMGLAADNQGNVYVADPGNNAIRKIDPAGNVSTLAGSTKAGRDNGRGVAASFNGPRSIAVDSAGTVYVADTGNYMIRKVTPDGTVSAFAGTGIPGSRDTADGSAMFGAIEGIATDTNGNVWVADTSNRLIRKVTPAGVVTTIAGKVTVDTFPDVDGPGPAARFHYPMALVVDPAGYVFVTGNGVIRKISPDGMVSTYPVIGTPGYRDGFADPTPFTYSRGIALDKAGNLYITETNLDLVRKITSY